MSFGHKASSKKAKAHPDGVSSGPDVVTGSAGGRRVDLNFAAGESTGGDEPRAGRPKTLTGSKSNPYSGSGDARPSGVQKGSGTKALKSIKY